ncbi:MAG: TrkH family potassium uptake protein [Dehalococcoidia bacterium]
MDLNNPRRPRDNVVRQPRVAELMPTLAEPVPERHPHRIFTTPFLLAFGFIALMVVGGLLLALPVASTSGQFTSLDISFFTATSAVTVTGHVATKVDTLTYWSVFGQAVIFFLMLIGGLGFMAAATFVLLLLGQRSSLPERLVMRDTMGVDYMGGLRRVTRNIVLVVFLIYLVGAALIFSRLDINLVGDMEFSERVWQSVFLSVSAFNNAGFSILPQEAARELGFAPLLLGYMMVLIIVGGVGWTVLVDLYRNHRFARLSLDTKLVIVTSLFLWALGAGVFFLAEFTNALTIDTENYSLGDKMLSSAFHSVSGRTAGFATVDFSQAEEFTKLTYPALMFIGGASGSVAGGIKVNTFAVIIAAVISSVRGRPQAEAFGREIAHFQVLRALTVGVLGVGFIIVVIPTLTLTEPDIPFLDLLFDMVSAFSTNGTSTGIVPDLSLAGKSIFMVAMLVGRLGPIILALALAPQEQTVYRFVQERVKIG